VNRETLKTENKKANKVRKQITIIINITPLDPLGNTVHLSASPAHLSFCPVVLYFKIPTARVFLPSQAYMNFPPVSSSVFV
jgi:hypothetical protein